MLNALIFDKDGTLFDFTASWGAWVRQIVPLIAPDPVDRPVIFSALGFDVSAGRFSKSSVVIASTAPQIAQAVHAVAPQLSLDALTHLMNEQAALAPMLPAVDLGGVLGDLRAMGLRLGVATNDSELPTRAHLAKAGIDHLFDFVAGSDSGFGGKPQAGQLLEFARQSALMPAQIAMVGDSLHDLHAAKAAGMVAIAVLTGVAEADELTPHADVVLPDIGHIAAWLAQR